VFKQCKVATAIFDENVEPRKDHLFSSITSRIPLIAAINFATYKNKLPNRPYVNNFLSKICPASTYHQKV